LLFRSPEGSNIKNRILEFLVILTVGENEFTASIMQVPSRRCRTSTNCLELLPTSCSKTLNVFRVTFLKVLDWVFIFPREKF